MSRRSSGSRQVQQESRAVQRRAEAAGSRRDPVATSTYAPGATAAYRLGCDPVGMDDPRPAVADEASIQQLLFPDLPCFGCGPSNTKGLRLRSFPSDDGVTATFLPWPEHDNGLGFLNGGIISTVLDCHSAAAVMWEADQRGWAPHTGAALPYVTAGLDVRFLRPSPLTEAVQLVARVGRASEAEILCDVELVWDGKTRAAATAVWKRWRPR
jgi:acyl-coenzyme A thioesterase PaaI-like protein